MRLKRWLSPGRILVMGFASVIILGTILLLLPISSNPGVNIGLINAFFTATSAVCVTGLAVVETAESFSAFGRFIIALLIQVGGLGFASTGAAIIILAGRKVGLRDRVLLKEAMNLESLKGIVRLVKSVLLMTLCFELVGFICSFIVFSKDYPLFDALGISAFHAVSAFNNAGFDILGGYKSLIEYQHDVLLNLTTIFLIIIGGLGFYVIREVIQKRKFSKFSITTKAVLVMTGSLLIIGTLFLKITEDMTWLGAFFQSVTARTAGFSTYSTGALSNAGLFFIMILMFIGASPGSTGGGIKTTTTFTLLASIFSMVTNRECIAFHRKIPIESIMKAFTIASLALLLIGFDTFLISIIEPQFTFLQVLFEVFSAFGTVGLSLGITPELSDISKIILSFTMFFGRVGPLTIACIWSYQVSSNISYAEEKILIG